MEHVGSFKGQGINLGPFEAKMLSESGETKESKEAKETAELLDSAFSDHLKLNFWWLFRLQSIWMNWLFQVFRKQKRLTTSSFWQKVDWPLVNVDKWPSEFELGPRYNPRGPPGGPPLRELMISQWWLGAKGQDKAWEGQRWRCANSGWRPGCCRVGLKMPMLKKWRPPFAWLERDFWQLLSILAIFMYQLQWRISRVVGTPQEWIWNVGELPVCRTSVMELVMCC